MAQVSCSIQFRKAMDVKFRLFCASFNGNNIFCLKACDPSGPRPARYCEHIFDIMGCGFNAPSDAKDGVFESCASESQDPPGEYVNAAGNTVTWKQGDGTVPYSVRVPRSTSCSQFRSEDIFEGGVTVQVPGAVASATVTSRGTSTSISTTTGVSSTTSITRTSTSDSTSITGSATTQGTPQNSDTLSGGSSNAVVGKGINTVLALLAVAVSFIAFA